MTESSETMAMAELVFTSFLGASHREDLERLLFFNENQSRASEGVAVVVQRYGTPRIVVEDDRLRIELSSSFSPQALYVVTRVRGTYRPVGVVVYTREDDALVVLFVAVDGELSGRGIKGHGMLLVRMIREVEAIARRVRGIGRVLVYTGRAEPTRIVVPRESGR
ncbi:MAG: hypothetical protein KDK70_04280 [Myxococcales bacterium]|nr:hypothetical protein [Myxococcales bacterium]